MHRATKVPQEIKYLGADVTELDRECEQIRKDIQRLLDASGRLENAALVVLDYLEQHPVGLNWYDVIGQVRAALREWQAVVQEVEDK